MVTDNIFIICSSIWSFPQRCQVHWIFSENIQFSWSNSIDLAKCQKSLGFKEPLQQLPLFLLVRKIMHSIGSVIWSSTRSIDVELKYF